MGIVRKNIKLEYDVCGCGKKKIYSAQMCKACYIKSTSAKTSSVDCACGRKKHKDSVECHVCRKKRILKTDSKTHKFDTCICGNIKRADVKQCRECFFKAKKEAIRICTTCGVILTPENCYKSAWQNGSRKCKKCYYAYGRKNYEKYKDMARARGQAIKQEVMAAYGGKCQCCGESNIAFLSIDHINNDGASHRRKMPGTQLYRWLKNNDFPQGDFQCLCMNCNIAKSNNPGGCPHEIERQRKLQKQN